MSIQFDYSLWRVKYLKDYTDTIGYFDQNTWTLENSPLFPSISKCVLGRGYLLNEEFVNICRWKTKRATQWYTHRSNVRRIESVSKDIIDRFKDCGLDGTSESIQQLISLKGVKIPVASALLTVLFPSSYCVIDYRVIQTLYYLDNNSDGVLTFSNFGEFSDTLSTLSKNPGIRDFETYLTRLSESARELNVSPRELEMALWKYSKSLGRPN